MKREAVAVYAANNNAAILEESVNEKTDEIAKLNSKIKRLEAKLKEKEEAPPAPANTSDIPDGMHEVKVCRPMGKGKVCGEPSLLEVRNGRLTKPLPGAKDDDELLEVKRGKNGVYTAKAPRLKFNPRIKF